MKAFDRVLINKFRDARIRVGLTQLEMATKLGYETSQYISNWERGLSDPPVERLLEIVKLLKLDPREVVDDMVLIYRRRISAIVFGKNGNGKKNGK